MLFVVQSWTLEDGLPVLQITDLLQTRDGYLWFSTFDGLVRFDGVQFTVFKTGNSEGLPSNRLVRILEASEGGLWILTEQEQLVLFREGRFTDFTLQTGVGSAPVLYESPSGDFWIGTRTGAFRFDGRGFVRVALGGHTGLVTAILVEQSGVAWIGTESQGLFRVDGRGTKRFTVEDGLASNAISSLAERPVGRVWIGAGSAIQRTHDGQVSPPLVTPPSGFGEVIAFHFVDGPDSLWVETTTGNFALRSGRMVPVTPARSWVLNPALGAAAPDGSLWLTSDTRIFRNGEEVLNTAAGIGGILHDHEGNVWVAGAGLHKLRPALFTTYGPRNGTPENVYPIYQDSRGTVWLGSMGSGLAGIDGEGIVRHGGGPPGPEDIVLSIREDRGGGLWVGGWNAGACRLTEEVCDYDFAGARDHLNGVQVRAIFEDAAGSLWFGTNGGARRLTRDGTWRRFAEADGLPHADVRLFAEDSSGALWIGTYGGGLVRYSEGTFTRYGTDQGLSSGLIRSMLIDEDGILWVGTEGNGLNRLALTRGANGDTLAVTVYRASDGLFDEGIHQILEDDFGRMWMSSNRGIFWVEKDELIAFAEGRTNLLRSTSYTERDGLLNREMNGGVQGAGIKGTDGRLWFPGLGGVAVVDPADIRRNEVPPPVSIEDVAAGGSAVPRESGRVRLAADQRNFEIAYTALSFAAPENVRFRYRLVGFDDDWVTASGRRTAFYTNVPPGEYEFRVVASNNDGVWNMEGASVTVTVAPYFHETGLFFGLMALTVAGFGVVGVRLRERGLRLRAARLGRLVDARTLELTREKETSEQARTRAEEQRTIAEHARETVEAQTLKLIDLDAAKSRFFANISHEFRTPLTLTIGPLEDVRDGRHGELSEAAAKDVELALRNSRRLLRLVNQILDVAKLEAGEMELHARLADVRVLLEGLVQAFTPLAERRSITLRLDAPSDEVDLWFDRDLLEKVFANLLSNALKFTPEGGAVRLSMEFVRGSEGAEAVQIVVKDSGPGIPVEGLERVFERFYQVDESQRRQEPGTGIGLALAKELIELHGGEIRVASEEGFGSAFTVTLFTGTGHLPPGSIEKDVHAPAESAAVAGPAVMPAVELADDEEWQDPRDPTERDGAPDRSPHADRPIVLVADDNAELRAFVSRHLGQRFRVIEAADGREALETARSVLPDLVVSDIMMPVLDGHELCRVMKSDPELDFIPVVLLTARAETEDRLTGLETGADDFLTKPFNARELKARVDNLIASRQRLRDRLRAQAAIHPRAIDVISADERFVDRVRGVVEAHMSDEEFDVAALGREVGHSRSSLYRKLGDLGVGSPAELIRSVRLERAAQLLAGHAGTVGEIAYGVGFKSVSHFSRSFREMFGVTPTEYRSGIDIATPATPS